MVAVASPRGPPPQPFPHGLGELASALTLPAPGVGEARVPPCFLTLSKLL